VFSVVGCVVTELSGGEPETTNNRMELTAAKEAISRAPLAPSLEIVTDSQKTDGMLDRGGALCGGNCRHTRQRRSV
jgi:ribonuclease HI